MKMTGVRISKSYQKLCCPRRLMLLHAIAQK